MAAAASRSVKRDAWLGAAAVVAALVFGPGLAHLARLAWMERQLNRRLAQLHAEEARLRDERDRLQHDPTYFEGLIRTTFKWAKPGEYVIPLDKREQ